jgi:uncharacterized repeat protein (TIGR03803 family)
MGSDIRWNRLSGRSLVLALATFAAIVCAPWSSAEAARPKTLHSFCAKLSCGDGAYPEANLISDQVGDLYGTARYGAHNAGVIFELMPSLDGRPRKYKVLYDFCAVNGCIDGSDLNGSNLIIDTSGNLYGTTSAGGSANDGVAFELSPNADSTHWKLRVIYNFCSHSSDCRDGAVPIGGLTYQGAEAGAPYDGSSPLYGVTSAGGRKFGGTAFSLTPATQGKWSEKVLYAFCQEGGLSCTDGYGPSAGLTIDAAGNLYGVTLNGGAGTNGGAGVVFKLASQQGQTKWLETVLHPFCTVPPNCSDGRSSYTRLIGDASGDLFGATELGGNTPYCPNFCGVVFEITSDGNETVLYTFCSRDSLCSDGEEPIDTGGLVLDSSGNLFGTANQGGGEYQLGTLFELKISSKTLRTLYSFCPTNFPCLDGALPESGLIQSASGTLYGTTTDGGENENNAGGTVFEIKP